MLGVRVMLTLEKLWSKIKFALVFLPAFPSLPYPQGSIFSDFPLGNQGPSCGSHKRYALLGHCPVLGLPSPLTSSKPTCYRPLSVFSCWPITNILIRCNSLNYVLLLSRTVIFYHSLSQRWITKVKVQTSWTEFYLGKGG